MCCDCLKCCGMEIGCCIETVTHDRACGTVIEFSPFAMALPYESSLRPSGVFPDFSVRKRTVRRGMQYERNSLT